MNHLYIKAIIIVLALLVLVLLRLVVINSWVKRKQLKRMRVGKKMEQRARRFISSSGFKQIMYQKQFEYILLENGVRKTVKLIPDFMAVKRGKKCLIEVKWGTFAPLIRNESTRRQLLEYNYAIKPDKLFLLDMTRKELKEVEFYD